MSTYQNIVARFPYYPILTAELDRAGISCEQVAEQLHISPDECRQLLNGESEALTIAQLQTIWEMLGKKPGLDMLMYHANEDVSPALEAAISEAAAALTQKDDDGQPDYAKYSGAYVGLNDFERWNITAFFMAVLAVSSMRCRQR